MCSQIILIIVQSNSPDNLAKLIASNSDVNETFKSKSKKLYL